MNPIKLQAVPARMVLPKPTVEELQAILDDPNPGRMISCGEHGLIPELRLADLRANIGGWMDNVAAGLKFAITRKGKILAFLLPPTASKPMSLRELEITLKIEAEIDDKES